MQAMSPEERRAYIGGSDWTDILDLDGMGCQRRAWFNKRDPIRWDGNSHTARGTRLEEVAAEEYERKTGRKLRRVNRLLTYATRPWYCGHIDRRTRDTEKGVMVVELKCPTVFQYRKAAREGARQGIIAQGTHYCGLLDCAWFSIGFFSAELWEVEIIDVAFDAALWARMIFAGDNFMRLVDNGPMPDAKPSDDPRCRRCQYRQRCHQEEALPAWEGDVKRDDSPELVHLLHQRAELEEIKSDTESEIATIKAKIGERVPAGQVVDAPGFRIYHTSYERKGYTVAPKTITSLRVFERRS